MLGPFRVVIAVGLVILGLVGCSSNGSGVDDEDVLTPQDLEEIETAYNSFSGAAEDALLSEDPVAAFEALVPSIESDAWVEDAWVSDGVLCVKFRRAGIVSWMAERGLVVPPYGRLERGSTSRRSPGGSRELVGNNKACFINQQYGDESRDYCRNVITHLETLFTACGYEVTTKNGQEADLEFFEGDLKEYGAIFYISHGGYLDSSNWLCSGEHGSISGLLLHHLSDWVADRVSITTIKEVHGSEEVGVCFYMFSDHFIENEYSAGQFPHSLIYLVACQAFTGGDALGEVFDSKGAAATVGWDETNCRGQSTGQLLFDAMLGGENLASAMANLPEEARVDECAVTPGANLVYYPSGGGSVSLVGDVDAEVIITSPVQDMTYTGHVVTLSGSVTGMQSISYGTVELNGVTTALTLTGATSFSQVLAIRNDANWVTVNCIGTLSGGATAFASGTVEFTGDFPAFDLWTELRWNTNYSDVDFHLLPPSSDLDDLWTGSDCYYGNRVTSWGGQLDVDDVDGYGPEHITLGDATLSGTYRLFAHYYYDHGAGETDVFVSVATMGGVAREFGPLRLVNNAGSHAGDVWEVCDIDFPSGTIYPIEQLYYLGEVTREDEHLRKQ